MNICQFHDLNQLTTVSDDKLQAGTAEPGDGWRRGSGMAVLVRGGSFGWISCCTHPQLKALARLCWPLVQHPLLFGMLLSPVGPTAMEGGRCSTEQNLIEQN